MDQDKHARSLVYLLHLLRSLAGSAQGDMVMAEIIERFGDGLIKKEREAKV